MDVTAFKHLAEQIGLAIDMAGALVIVIGLAWAVARFLRRPAGGYRRLRQDIGRGILLGLEFMVAGDIIHTVAVEPTLEALAVLAGIVLVRTFLSLSLEVELEGCWPWRNAQGEGVTGRE